MIPSIHPGKVFLRHVLSGLLGQPSAHGVSLETTDIRWPSQRLIARSHELGKVVESLNESLSPMHMSPAQWSQAGCVRTQHSPPTRSTAG